MTRVEGCKQEKTAREQNERYDTLRAAYGEYFKHRFGSNVENLRTFAKEKFPLENLNVAINFFWDEEVSWYPEIRDLEQLIGLLGTGAKQKLDKVAKAEGYGIFQGYFGSSLKWFYKKTEEKSNIKRAREWRKALCS